MVGLDRILYLRQSIYLEVGVHHLEVFVLAKSFEGRLTTENLRPDEPDAEYIKSVGFLSLRKMRGPTLFPEVLRSKFWLDLEAGALEFSYLGLEQAGGSGSTETSSFRLS